MDPITHERLRWACRRGMLELDLFLVPFFEHQYQHLNTQEQNIFANLLTTSDPQLLAWLMAHENPPNPEFTAIVEKIRQFRLQHSAALF